MSGNVRIGVSLPKVYPRTIVRVNRLRPVGEEASFIENKRIARSGAQRWTLFPKTEKPLV